MGSLAVSMYCFFFFQAEDGIRDYKVTGVQTCALPIFTARGVTGVVTLEGTEMVDQPVGLRAVVVRQDREIRAEGDGILLYLALAIAVTVFVQYDARDVHGLGA